MAEDNIVSLVPALLREIRDEVRSTNTRLDKLDERLSGRIDETNTRLDRLERRQTEADIRLSTSLIELQKAQNATTEAVRALIAETRTLHARLDHVFIGPMGAKVREHEDRLDTLTIRMDAVERRAG
jgi:chromosome segregation ATPase